jgi:hypothetical protein
LIPFSTQLSSQYTNLLKVKTKENDKIGFNHNLNFRVADARIEKEASTASVLQASIPLLMANAV